MLRLESEVGDATHPKKTLEFNEHEILVKELREFPPATGEAYGPVSLHLTISGLNEPVIVKDIAVIQKLWKGLDKKVAAAQKQRQEKEAEAREKGGTA